ncbi:MAG: hypothetical protein WBA74_05735 [Cyclobacteriaceae bacterium]
MADITVTMKVDTAQLKNGTTVASCCMLSDNNNDTPASETFEIDTTNGKNVQFEIQALDGSTPIGFNSFTYEGGTENLFNPWPDTSNAWTGTVDGEEDQEETFDINFYVDYPAPTGRSNYTLDPKLKVMQSGGGG